MVPTGTIGYSNLTVTWPNAHDFNRLQIHRLVSGARGCLLFAAFGGKEVL